MSKAPFSVVPSVYNRGKWMLFMRNPIHLKGVFDSQAEAIDYAYRNWPWWP